MCHAQPEQTVGATLMEQANLNQLDMEWWHAGSGRWRDVWVSPAFQALARRPSWLSEHVIPLMEQHTIGWITVDPTNRFYFSAWLMNSVMRRTYQNPLIQDLYVLHEALHACTMDRYFDHSPDAFVALRTNEIEVSLETEAWVYIRHPEWVGQTFDPLWVTQAHVGGYTPTGQRMGEWDEEYRALQQKVGWVVPRPPVANRFGTYTEESVWEARRKSTHYPLTQADQGVRKYERLSAKWINYILPYVNDVVDARQHLRKGDMDAWMRALERNMHHGLPFGHLQLPIKKKGE